jgi:predicted LPLAT superfamily acyltransferase
MPVLKHTNKCLSLCNTKHILHTFWFLLQACWYLLAAVKSGDVNRTKIWLKYTNEKCTTKDNSGKTPLVIAVEFGDMEMVRVLLESRANVGNPAYQDMPLYIAAGRGNLDMCRLLLDWNANVDATAEYRRTPLHAAARIGRLSIVKLLVERGADVSLTDYNSRTASDLARIEGMTDVAEWLVAEGRVAELRYG